MKTKSILLIVFLFLCVVIKAQTSNEIRLSEIDKEIEVALSKEEYVLASNLNKEKVLRQQINEALAVNDTEKIKQLENEIENLYKSSDSSSTSNPNSSTENSSKKESISSERNSNIPKPIMKENYLYRNHMKSGFFLEVGFGFGYMQGGYYEFMDLKKEGTYYKIEVFSPVINTNFGNIIYFNKNYNRNRIGIKISPLSMNIYTEDIQIEFDFVNFGPYYVHAIKEESAIELGATVGAAILAKYVHYPGYVIQGEFLYRYRLIGVGLDLKYSRVSDYIDAEDERFMNSISANVCIEFKF